MGNAVTLPSDWEQPDIISQWVKHQMNMGLRPRTIVLRCSILNWLELWLNVTYDISLLDAEHEHLVAWREVLNVADNSVITYVNAVRAFYLWANRSRIIGFDPAWNVPAPRKRHSRPRPIGTLSLEEAIELAERPIRTWLILAAYAGLRASDIAGMRVHDVVLHGKHPHLMIGEYAKGGRERIVPLSAYVVDELRAHRLPARGPVFQRPRGDGPVTAKDVSDRCNRFLHKHGFVESLHQLRHWFGTEAHSVEPDLRVLQDVMGHGDPATTALYAAPSDVKAHDMVSKIQPKNWR